MQLKIMAIADRRPQQSLKELCELQNPDVIVTLGDLDMFEIRDLELITDRPKLGVYGNHCSGMYFEELGIVNMHLETVSVQGVVFGGFEGCVRYKESKTAKMYTQDEAKELLTNYPYVDVMLTHCPPYGINDEPDELTHMGFLGLRSYLDNVHPKHWFHGHTYPKEGEQIFEHNGTQIHYVSGVEVLTIEV